MTAKTSTDLAPEPLDPDAHDPQFRQEVERLQSLLSRGKVEEARRLARELEERWPGSDLARQFARVLAPPVARVVQGKKGLTREQTERESAWLREAPVDTSIETSERAKQAPGGNGERQDS